MKRRSGQKADAITPVGADDPLPPRPARVPMTDADQERAVAEWDRAMESQDLPNLRGLLDARVED